MAKRKDPDTPCPVWKKGNRSRSPYENAAAAMQALHSRHDVTRSELREIIAAGRDDHQVIRVWRWLLDSGFAVSGEMRGRAETLRLSQMWRGPRDEKPNAELTGAARDAAGMP